MEKEMLEQIKSIADGMVKMEERINKRLDCVDKRLDAMQADIEQIKEDTAVTRATTNIIGEWIEVAAPSLKIDFPLAVG